MSDPLPNTAELFTRRELASRHPNFLNEHRVAWALRNRRKNGLQAAGAVYETAGNELLIREPAFIAWFLGLAGRAKPRAARRHRRSEAA